MGLLGKNSHLANEFGNYFAAIIIEKKAVWEWISDNLSLQAVFFGSKIIRLSFHEFDQ